MEQQGGILVKHYRDLAFMGFAEVVKHLPAILGNFRFCQKDLVAFKPDVLILVDYPGFNLRMAAFARKAGIKVFYYISPQVWAWKSSRVHGIRKNVDRMFVILPFEKEFYARYDYPVEFVGHPLLDLIGGNDESVDRTAFLQKNNLDDRPIVALLPGSRKMEIGKMLRTMMQVIPDYPGCQFVVAGAPAVDEIFYHETLAGHRLRVVMNRTYELLQYSSAALVTSGTATLETALFRVPQIVCYRGNYLSYLIARRLIHVPYISLVNLISGKQVVRELIQQEFNRDTLSEHLDILLNNPVERDKMLEGYRQLREKLGGAGASRRCATEMVRLLNKKK